MFQFINYLKKMFISAIATNEKTIVPSLVSESSNDPASVNHLGLCEKFTAVYKNNIFNGKDSRSGEGSSLLQTEIIRKAIPNLLKELNIRSMLDAPCGDWHWMKETDLNCIKYVGVDIVESLININQEKYGNEYVSFKCVNLTDGVLPTTDLIFSRDCLVHLSYDDALKAIRNFKKSGAKYLLATTFSERDSNIDLGTGFWRPLNHQLSPFYFPKPLELINEGCTEGNNLFTDKCLGLWLLNDIPV